VSFVLQLKAEAKATASIIRSIFDVCIFIALYKQVLTLLQRIENIPTVYERLRHITLRLTDELENVAEAGSNFKTKSVRNAMNRLIELIVNATHEISNHYSQSKPSKSCISPNLPSLTFPLVLVVKDFFSPRSDQIDTLIRDLENHKETIRDAFLTEIQGGVARANSALNQVLLHQDEGREKQNRKLLRLLTPPKESMFFGKPECLEGTRRSMLADVRKWSEDATRVSNLFWLYGVAGCGKSTLAASASRIFEERLAGSFFCKRDEVTRRDPVQLIRSVAFHLATKHPAFKRVLCDVLQESDIFVNEDLDSQFERLLRKPLQRCENLVESSPVIFVIDALDECGDSDKLSGLLLEVMDLAPCLLFFITSRDLPGIRWNLTKIEHRVEEHDLFQFDAHDDIRVYINHQLSEEGRLADLRPFATTEMVDILVFKSQGLFIWMYTVVDFLIKVEVGKLETLEGILRSENTIESEAALDSLYRTVLENASGSTKTGKGIVRFIIGFILITSPNALLTMSALHAFLPHYLSVLETEFIAVFKKLLPVLIIGRDGLVRVYHISFLDFSSKKSRCLDFFMDASELHLVMATGCLEIMENGSRNARRQKTVPSGLKFNICKLETSHIPNSQVTDLNERIAKFISPELRYSCVYWMEHLQRASLGTCESHISNSLFRLLCTTRSLFWIEIMSLLGRLHAARAILVQLRSEAKVWYTFFYESTKLTTL
jgi:uncharacterized membrane protein (DUF373 family)